MAKAQRSAKARQAAGGQALKQTTTRKATKSGSRTTVPQARLPPVTNHGASADSEQTTAPGRRSARLAGKSGLSVQVNPPKRRKELPVSSRGVGKKTSKTAKAGVNKNDSGQKAASGLWQTIQAAPGSVSKMLAPAVSPISSFLGSASQAVSATFSRMLAPSPSPLAVPEMKQVDSVTAMQMKLEGKAP